jgi:hypothetical protein
MQFDDSQGEWDGDEYNGWTFHPYNSDEVIILEKEPTLVHQNGFHEKDYLILESNKEPDISILISRSYSRDAKTGEILFDISYNYESNKIITKRTGLTKLIDLNDNTVEYEDIANAINNWINVAKKYPNVKRNCLCCNNRTIKSFVLCKSCKPKYYDSIYA